MSRVIATAFFATLVILASCNRDFTTDCSVGEKAVPAGSLLRIGVGPFTYDENTPVGPSNWGNIDCPNFSQCSSGHAQSPLNLLTEKVHLKDPSTHLSLSIHPKSHAKMKYHAIPNDFEVECAEKNGCGEMNFHGTRYNLAKMHFHSPSEYMLNGFQSEMELHLVHQSATGNFAVLGIFVSESTDGKDNAAFNEILRAAKERGHANIDIKSLIGSVADFPEPCTFRGSLTTPPCTEGIQWILSTTPIVLSRRQIDFYKNMTGNSPNNRPTQPINSRHIKCYTRELPRKAPVCSSEYLV